jgi:threonine aldolase
LQDLADWLEGSEMPDTYGSGKFINDFEDQIASLLGKEAGVFMPSGTMAQQIALRIHCEHRSNFTVAMHPTSHLEFAEHAGLTFLHNIKRLQFAAPEFVSDRVLVREDFDKLAVMPGAILLELPYRPLGGQLPSWTELTAIADWAREREVPMHLDGARIWQCTRYYGRSLKEICDLFATVYVSFYKDLGGIAGCILAGSQVFVDESRVWQRRYGGNLYDQSPMVAAARKGVIETLPHIDSWVERAIEVARVCTEVKGVKVAPDPPCVNFFQLYLPGDAESLTRKHHELAAETGTFLFSALRPADVPGYAKTEIHCFENSMNFDLGRLPAFLESLLLNGK